MKVLIKITRQTVAARKNVLPGEIIEVEVAEANLLIGMNKAVKHEVAQETEPIKEHDEVIKLPDGVTVDQEVVPAPPKKGKKKHA